MPSLSEARAVKHPGSIAIVNYKGGVGKTTVTYLLSLYIALRTGRKVLVLDIDPQCSLTFAVGFDPAQIALMNKNIYDLVRPSTWGSLSSLRINEYVRSVPGLSAPLYIVPGAFQVEDLDVEITEALYEKRERSKAEFFLFCRQLINSFQDYSYVLIDTPPNKMYLTQGMLRAARFYIPVTIPDGISVYGMPRLLNWVSQIEDEERPQMLGYVLNTVNRTGGSPAGMVGSQQVATDTLNATLWDALSRLERGRLSGGLQIGGIPRLDQIARFMGATKEIRLDFAQRTSGQPTVDACLNDIAQGVLGRMRAYDA